MDQELGRSLVRECLAKLLNHPRCGQMLGDVEVQNFAAAVGDHEPDDGHLEADRRDHGKVHRREHVAMISQERGPSLQLVVATTSFREVARHSFETDSGSQLLELGLNSSCTPRVLAG